MDNQSQINDIFEGIVINDCENNVSEILKKIYTRWFFYHHDFNNPITKQVCRQMDNILPQEDGGGPVQYSLY